MMRRLSYRLSNSVVWESQKFSIIRKKINAFLKGCVGGKFFENFFFGFFRGLLIMMRRLRYRLSDSIVWEPQKFSIIQKNNSSFYISDQFIYFL